MTKNLYVRKGAGGSNNGSDWNNAWNEMNQIGWPSVNPGDVIWIAGGTYTTQLAPTRGGAANNWVYLERVRATDAAPTAAAGWNSSFDSQVIVSPSDTALSFNTLGIGYIYIDGRVDRGIQLVCPNSTNRVASCGIDRGLSYLTLTNIDLLGPGSSPNGNSVGNNPINMNQDLRAVDTTAWNGSAYETVDHLVVSHCRMRGHVTELWLMNVQNGTIEYNQIYDNAALNHEQPYAHANVCAASASTNVVWRYNNIYNWQVEGIMMIFTSCASWYIYGNLWHDGMGGAGGNTHRILEPQDSVQGPIYFYNNTVVNVYMGIRSGGSGLTSWTSDSQQRNNIFWNISSGGNGLGLPGGDYDFTQAANAETHGIGNGSNPFVNYAGANYHIVTNIAAACPRNKGIALTAPYSVDLDGNLRGGDGAWDMGVFEAAGAVAPPPSPPTNLRILSN